MRRMYMIVAMMIAMLSAGCTVLFDDALGNTETTRNVGSPLPDISTFSATKYEQTVYMFPPIQSAVYVHDGISETIDPNDPRLIRLLNSLSFSYSEGYTAWRQGHVEEAEFFTFVNSGKPMLDICFDINEPAENDNEFSETPRVIVSANRYLLLVDTSKSNWMADNSIYANEHFPYAELLCNFYLDLTDEEFAEIYGDIEWGNSKWIDLLEYAGFE